MQTCNHVKNIPNNGIALVSSTQNLRGLTTMPSTKKVTPIRGNDLTLVDTIQAAEILQINERTLTNWRSTGKSPKYVKIGRSVRYRISDLMTWIEANSRNHTGEVA
jgi:predicted DNA-binding transcriptional regulator AlpA